ncbi:MAG: hypothetical protein ACJAZK_001096 [Psychroserpens sp.]|uniref:hypothetical protein n=1 Tax=Psychroserpens sp. TaxID=2020870 RepID=UPI0039E7102F
MFYQAIIKEDDTRNDDASKFTEISLVNYEGDIINPIVLLERYPDTKKYMLNDSIMTINSGVVIQGFIEDLSKLDSRMIIENFHFKKYVLLNLSLYGELESEIFNASVLRIRHCVFDDSFLTWFCNFNLDFRDNSFNELITINETETSPRVVIENNTIGYLHFWTATLGIVTIAENQIGYVEIDLSSFRNLKLLKIRIYGLGTSNYSQEEIIGRKYWKSYINLRRAQRLVALDKLSEDSLYSYNDISGKVLFQMNSLNRVVSELEIIGNSFLDPTHSKRYEYL